MLRNSKRQIKKPTVPQIKVHNRFELITHNVITGQEQTYIAENVILNKGFDMLFSTTIMHKLAYGSSTEPEDPSQTGLLAKFGEKRFKNSTPVEKLVNASTISETCECYISTSEHNGQTFAEMGIVSNDNRTFNRALFKDINGNPITIMKDDTIEITIFATIFIELSLQPHQRVCYYQKAYRAYPIYPFGVPGASYGTFSGAAYGTGSGKLTPGEKTVTYKCARIEPTVANSELGIITSSNGPIEDYYPLKDLSEYALVDEPLGTGNGTKVAFGAPQAMKTISIKKNGVEIPSSDYVFNPSGNENGNTNEVYRSPFYIDPETLEPADTACSYNWPPKHTHPIITGRWYTFKSVFDGNAIFSLTASVNGDVDYTKVEVQFSNDGIVWSESIIGTSPFKPPFPSGWFRVRTKPKPPFEVAKGLLYAMVIVKEPQIKFKTPPANGDVLTYSGIPGVIPKTDQYVLDATMSLDWSPGI